MRNRFDDVDVDALSVWVQALPEHKQRRIGISLLQWYLEVDSRYEAVFAHSAGAVSYEKERP